jgi:hypothetical protein
VNEAFLTHNKKWLFIPRFLNFLRVYSSSNIIIFCLILFLFFGDHQTIVSDKRKYIKMSHTKKINARFTVMKLYCPITQKKYLLHFAILLMLLLLFNRTRQKHQKNSNRHRIWIANCLRNLRPCDLLISATGLWIQWKINEWMNESRVLGSFGLLFVSLPDIWIEFEFYTFFAPFHFNLHPQLNLFWQSFANVVATRWEQSLKVEWLNASSMNLIRNGSSNNHWASKLVSK